jgi:glycolate oxidase iron-sulfur subunit
MLLAPCIGFPVNLQQSILRDADRCVLCGMCLPHCPTYARSGNEAESPRGRISLMLALARGQLEPTPALVEHLDSCLACRACETKCPSEVAYGRLIGAARRLIAEHRPPAWKARLLANFTSSAGLLEKGVALARGGFGRTVLRLLGMEQAGALAARDSRALPARTAVAASAPRGRVALFTGCTGQAFDAETVQAAERLLGAAGFAVEMPEGRNCCGALHHHLGDSAGFEERACATLASFGDLPVDAVLFLASGCGAMLREYGTWLASEQATGFARRCMEITDFLAARGLPDGLRFRLPEGAVAIHVPCSQANVLKAGGATERLLRAALPDAHLAPLPQNHVCCGAAGSHMLLHADTAQALREPKLDALEQSGARFLVTTNVGCALHLAAGARARGLAVEVLHPVALLARLLAD